MRVGDFPYTINIQVADGNQIALNPAVEFNYTISNSDPLFSDEVVLVFGRTFVRVEDLDSNSYLNYNCVLI